jgi:arsenate reductase-like glutaredoxin family protein
MPVIQVFGTKKCPDTRKAERFFRERRVPIQFVDLAKKGLSPGELASVAARVGGLSALADTESKRWIERGLKYAAPTGPRLEAILLEDPLLLRTPIVRSGRDATIGYQPDVWARWISPQNVA